MFSVYKITNLINNKCYIGSSIRPYFRWKQHIATANNSHAKHYDYPLYSAFRKYGIENFSFEILKDDFDSAEKMSNYERDMIIYYNSLDWGYNQTLFTDCALRDPIIKKQFIDRVGQKCAKIDKDNNIIEIYNSYQEAARLNNLENSASHVRQVCKGQRSSCNDLLFRDLDNNGNIIIQPFKSYKARKPVIGIKIDDPLIEVYAESILEASQKFHIDRCSLHHCLNGSTKYTTVGGYIWRLVDECGNIIPNNLDIDTLIAQYNESHPLINGERKTVSEWCKIFNITRHSVYCRVSKGMDIVTAITKPKVR